MFVEMLKELKKTYMQVILSGTFLLADVEVITWIILAFWGIKLALRVLVKDIKRSSIYAYK